MSGFYQTNFFTQAMRAETLKLVVKAAEQSIDSVGTNQQSNQYSINGLSSRRTKNGKRVYNVIRKRVNPELQALRYQPAHPKIGIDE